MTRILVTGGAGFIGSHLVDRLVEKHDVAVLDDLSGGSIENIQRHLERPGFVFTEGSIVDSKTVEEAVEDIDLVFHLAAQPDVRLSVERPLWDFRINVEGSMQLLEAIRKSGVKRIIFASSGGTVYGESEVFPTPEETAFRPISNYGAAKGAFEMYLNSYSELYGINAVSLRLGNIIGPRLTHGVIYDFFMKLQHNPSELEVLGDGTQVKAYMYIDDTIDAMVLLSEKTSSGHLPINVSSGERLKVSRIAELVIEELELDARIRYTGTDRGWAGDVTVTDIDISLLESMGWKSKTPLEEGVRKYIQWLIGQFGVPG
ncbi:NAD-dependent epimerase/dehydratase family protein [Candidatus Thorarchaeota archaeon]|nr:MAG: NAD-dependent epimerase/dehydratase family protein [Candidatus Thorarchaeota archaeon]